MHFSQVLQRGTSRMADSGITQALRQAVKAATAANELAQAIAARKSTASISSVSASIPDRDHNPDPGSNGGSGGSGTTPNTNAPGQHVASDSTSSAPASTPGNGNPGANGQAPSNQEPQLSNDSSEIQHSINSFNNTLWRNATLVASMVLPTEPTGRPAAPPPPPFGGAGKIRNGIKEELHNLQLNLMGSAARAGLFLISYEKLRASSLGKFLSKPIT